MNEKEMVKGLVNYIHNLLEFIDVDNFEDEENVKIVNGGYKEFVEPANGYLNKQ